MQNKSRKWFTLSGRSKQASKQANIHTHGCNEVTLVWGSLRLASITISCRDARMWVWKLKSHSDPVTHQFASKNLPPGECTNAHANDRYYHSAALSNQISCICLHMRVPVRLKNERNWRRALSRVIPSTQRTSSTPLQLSGHALTCRHVKNVREWYYI